MATFLQLVQKLRQESGASGTGPSAVTGQSGEMKRLVDWVVDAWNELQYLHPNWRWMRKGFTVNTVAGDDSYAYGDCTDTATAALITRFARWWADDTEDPLRCYLQSGGVANEYRLIYLPWENFKWLYKMGTQNNGKPAYVSVDHDDNLVLGPKPDAVYVISGDYQRGPQVLAANNDTPELPLRFHNLIVYDAMELRYAGYESAPEVLMRARALRKRLLTQLRLNQLPQPDLSAPMA